MGLNYLVFDDKPAGNIKYLSTRSPCNTHPHICYISHETESPGVFLTSNFVLCSVSSCTLWVLSREVPWISKALHWSIYSFFIWGYCHCFPLGPVVKQHSNRKRERIYRQLIDFISNCRKGKSAWNFVIRFSMDFLTISDRFL